MSNARKWSLIGFSDDQGVLNVGGRLGAALGPQAFGRLWFPKLAARLPAPVAAAGFEESFRDEKDTDLDRALENAALLLADHHAASGLSIVIGGGHDYGYAHLKGVGLALSRKFAKKVARLGCLNIDAHFDLRSDVPVMTSGSPFFRSIERQVLDPKRLTEFGVQAISNAPELWAYAKKNKVRAVSFEEIRHLGADGGKERRNRFKAELKRLARMCDQIVVQIDLDALSQAHAPGVSAPAAEGFSATDLFGFIEECALERKVCSLGVYELNPHFDRDSQTARLATGAVFKFLDRRFSA